MPESFEILDRINEKYPTFSPNARLIANYIQQHPMALLTLSLAELATVTKTSKATVSRFFRKLGYESHQAAMQTLIALRTKGLPLQNSIKNTHLIESEIDNFSTTLSAISEQQLDKIASDIANAKTVTVVGYRSSYPVAMHCRQQLAQIRPNTYLLPQPGQSVGEELLDIDESSLVIIMGFRRRPSIFSSLIQQLSNHQTILFTDPTGQIYNQNVEELVVCPLGHEFAFDSYAVPMGLISIICNKVYQTVGNKASTRASAISKLYDNLEELENK